MCFSFALSSSIFMDLQRIPLGLIGFLWFSWLFVVSFWFFFWGGGELISHKVKYWMGGFHGWITAAKRKQQKEIAHQRIWFIDPTNETYMYYIYIYYSILEEIPWHFQDNWWACSRSSPGTSTQTQCISLPRGVCPSDRTWYSCGHRTLNHQTVIQWALRAEFDSSPRATGCSCGAVVKVMWSG